MLSLESMVVLSFGLLLLHARCLEACNYPDCDRPDKGSCGNACCKLYALIKDETTTNVMHKLKVAIESGGPDSRFVCDSFHLLMVSML